MAATLLSDVIVPEVFLPNAIERTAEKSDFIQSGIVSVAGDIPIGRGKAIELPFYQDLTGEDNVWDDTEDIQLNKIGMAQDTAVVLTREKAWGASDLSAALMGDDPMGAITELYAGYWSRRYQRILIATLNGAMSATSMSSNVLDISGLADGAEVFDAESFIDAQARLGDHQDSFVGVAVHSATYTAMKKQDLIDFVPDSEGKPSIPTYMGKRVIVDDGMPVSDGVYTTYLFASGAVTMVEEVVENAVEVARHPEKNGGTDALYTRKKLVMHPRGIRWTPGANVPSAATPSNTELATATNWTRVWEPKNVRVVKFVHKLG